MNSLYRTQILLETEQHQTLTALAQENETSLSELVRDIVRQHLLDVAEQARKERQLKAIDNLTKLRLSIQAEHGVLASNYLEDVRNERMADQVDVLEGE